VVRVRPLTPRVREYIVDLGGFEARPGQFVMLWDPGVGEIPLSVAGVREGLRLVVARRGRVTSHLHGILGPGSRVHLRGPYGRGFSFDGVRRALIVGGGYGVAPLLYLAERLSERGAELDVLLGFRTGDDVMYVEEFGRLASSVSVATEDGSYGVRGLVTDLLPGEADYDAVYTCGREAMMVKVVRWCLGRGLRVEASLERLVRCGIGICGSCALEPLGLRVCSDGPVFEGRTLAMLEDFGRYWRGPSGVRVEIGPGGRGG